MSNNISISIDDSHMEDISTEPILDRCVNIEDCIEVLNPTILQNHINFIPSSVVSKNKYQLNFTVIKYRKFLKYIFMEMLKYYISCNNSIQTDLVINTLKDYIYSVKDIAIPRITNTLVNTLHEITKHNYYMFISDVISKGEYEQLYYDVEISHSVNYSQGYLTGKSDILVVGDDNKVILYAVIVAENISKLRKKEWYKLYSLACLFEHQNYIDGKYTYVVDKICLFLPLQNNITTIDFYNSREFTEYLFSGIDHVISIYKDKSMLSDNHATDRSNGRFGATISRSGNIHDSIVSGLEYIFNCSRDNIILNCSKYPHCGVQIFLANNFGVSISGDDIINTRRFIQLSEAKVFCHNIHTENLCNSKLSLSKTIDSMKYCVQLCFKGLVIHCGNNVNMLSKDDATMLMYYRLSKIIDSATEKCPVILETPAGVGTVLCAVVTDFLHFYSLFDETQRSKLKICIDTCHVFAAGYNPYEYICMVNEYFPNSIALVHLNGSMHDFGSKLDAHCPIYTGFIPRDIIESVINFCIYNNIPMVSEWMTE